MKKSEFEGWAGLIGALLLLGAALIPGYQIVLWLRVGYWTPIPLDLAFGWIGVDAVTHVASMQLGGVKKICMWMLTVPLSVAFVALAIAHFYVLDWLGNGFAGDRSDNPPQPRA
jgi:hypothetical protein